MVQEDDAVANATTLQAQRPSRSTREREVYRFLEPWRNNAQALNLFKPISLSNQPQTSASRTVGCDDTALAAFAQLGVLRLNADRALVQLFSKEHEFILAESTRTLSLQSDATHSATDALWIGTASYPRSEGLSNLVLPSWMTAKGRRPAMINHGYYHTQDQTPHALIVSDLCNNTSYETLFPRFNSNIRFLCSVPLRSLKGFVIGAYTVIGTVPRYGISEDEMVFLEDMAETVVNHLASRRAMLQKQNAERLIKGLGVFSQGGSSLREWWLESFDAEKQRSRRQEQNIAQDESLRERKADEELGDTFKHGQNSGQVGLKGQSNSLHKQSLNDIRGRAFSSTETQDFAAKNGETVSNHVPHSEDLPGRSSSTNFDIRHATSQLFARASNLLREGMNVDGVVFLDAGFTKGKGRRSARMRRVSVDGLPIRSGPESTTTSADSDSLSSSTDRSTASETTTGKKAPGRGEKCRRTDTRRQKSLPHCEPLGYSTRTGSSMRNFAFPPRYVTFPQRRMEKLIQTWPHGKIFNFGDDGNMDSSSGHEWESVRAASEGSPDILMEHSSRSVRDADLLYKICDGARSVAFIPVWDPHREKWRSGALVWVTTPGRHFTREEDLAYLSSFSDNISGELLRLDMLASDQAKATFISMMSHELRSPLHGVLAGAEFLLDTNLDQVQQEMATTVKLAGSALLDTINAILDFTKINTTSDSRSILDRQTSLDRHDSDDSVERENCIDLAYLTESVVNTVVAGQRYRATAKLQSQKSSNSVPHLKNFGNPIRDAVQVIVDISHRSNWQVNVHAGTWVRILTNLVGNALKYTKEGYVHVKLRSDGKNVTLAIEDTGAGISLDYQKHRMYTAFAQEDTLATGTGLGLYIVKQLVNRMQGEIAIESDVTQEQGTKISVVVPVLFAGASVKGSDSPTSPIGPLIQLPNLSVAMLATPLRRRSDNRPSTARVKRLQSSISKTSEEWLQTPIREIESIGDAASFDVCFALQSDFEHWLKFDSPTKSASKCRFIVLTEDLSAGYATSSRADVPVHLILDPPFGPRKLARVLGEAVDSTPFSVQTPTQSTQSTPWKLNDGMAGGKAQNNASGSGTSTEVQSPLPDAHRKLLLVEDNELNMKLLVAWCRKLGVKYITAENGLEAVQAYQSTPTFDIVLMDISMPIMDGFTAAREIRSFEKKHKVKHCRIVAITGVASEDARNDANKAGIDDFIVKPASLSRLRQLLKELDDEDAQA